MNWNPMPFSNQSVLVTGAGRGIGQATAIKFASAGASLVLCDIDESSLGETKALLPAETEALALAMDLTADQAPQAVMEAAIRRFGRVDVVVNNAGYIWNGAMHRHTDEQWWAMLEIHATVPFKLLQAYADWMIPQAKSEIAASGTLWCARLSMCHRSVGRSAARRRSLILRGRLRYWGSPKPWQRSGDDTMSKSMLLPLATLKLV